MTLYNEIDPYACNWLQNLSDHGQIAQGLVDRRSIADLQPSDVAGHDQAHFFAGIGGWSYALRLAGWPDDRPVWTGSCPCQPFSGAGKGGGFSDLRHLWPTWFRLIRECHPPTIFGEQVASPAALEWWDAVSADLETEGYAVAAVDLGAACVGAPHIRQRLFWMAHAADSARREGRAELSGRDSGGHAGGLGNTQDDVGRLSGGPGRLQNPQPVRACQTGGLVNAERDGRRAGRQGDNGRNDRAQLDTNGGHDWTSPLDGFWRDADWLRCTDGKWRPVEPGSCPLAHGIPARMGKLRAYGNAIVPQVAAEFIKAYIDSQYALSYV